MTPTKTILIYDQCGEDRIKFAVLDGDYAHLDGIYLNAAGTDQAKEDELNNLLADIQLLDKFPIDQAKGCIVIVAGFLP